MNGMIIVKMLIVLKKFYFCRSINLKAMTRKGNFRMYFSVVIMVLVAVSLNAQTTITDVINSFNAGAEQVNAGDFDAAIAKFEETIALADELGAEGDEMKTNATGQIPALHYRIALDTYKAKDIPGAITRFESTVEACDKYGGDDIKAKSLKYIPQLYNAQGNSQVKASDFEGAHASFDKAIEYKPDYARAVYGKALVYKRQKDDANMVATMQEAIEVGTAAGDDKTVAAATKTLKDYHLNTGKIAFKAENYDDAIASFDKSYAYDDEDAEPYYLTCVAYGKKGEFEKAVEYGIKAALFEEEANQAKIWYEVGAAYTSLDDYTNACEAFSKALVEPYLNSVKYQMENVLDCQ
jgi:tetratricopeptide (TPR) repeat protein